NIEKQVLLQTIDAKWRDHLLTLEHLRSVVGFRGYAQRDPLSEYKTEGFSLFESMLESLRAEVTQKLSRIRPLTQEEQEQMMRQFLAQQQGLNIRLADPGEGEPAPLAKPVPLVAGFDEADP